VARDTCPDSHCRSPTHIHNRQSLIGGSLPLLGPAQATRGSSPPITSLCVRARVASAAAATSSSSRENGAAVATAAVPPSPASRRHFGPGACLGGWVVIDLTRVAGDGKFPFRYCCTRPRDSPDFYLVTHTPIHGFRITQRLGHVVIRGVYASAASLDRFDRTALVGTLPPSMGTARE
jgi:hypothetical protein